MPASKKKPTTLSPESSTPESSSNTLPEQEEFRQYLRRLAVSAIQVLIEQVMREDLEQCIGASWGECTPNRRGYRNDSCTSLEEIERALHVLASRERGLLATYPDCSSGMGHPTLYMLKRGR